MIRGERNVSEGEGYTQNDFTTTCDIKKHIRGKTNT